MSKQGTRGRWNSGASQRYSPVRKIDDARWIQKKGVWRLEEKQRSEQDWCFTRRERVGYARGAKLRTFNQPHIA